MSCTRMWAQKNYSWVWTSVSRNDREYVDFVVGNRGTKTGLRLWEKVGRFAQGAVMADYWKSYNEIVPCEQLIQTKAETYTVESYNGLIRHFSAGFRRKTRCYSKPEEMIILSLKLFFEHRNKTINYTFDAVWKLWIQYIWPTILAYTPKIEGS